MSTPQSPTLELFTEEVDRVLCVVAHPDDMEYGGSAAVAEWTSRGVQVAYLLLTAGEAGLRDREPAEVAALRAEEQRRACELVGVRDRKSTRLNSSHVAISYAVFCLKKKKK